MRSRSSQRIVLIGGVVLAAGLLVGLGLYRLMIEQRGRWLERSYRNRWAFRDVPARRGAITDRDGRVLVVDQPRFALELDYRTFRRRHPLGAAISALDLVDPAAGYTYASTSRGPVQAGMWLLTRPVAELHRAASDRDTARDLRFYALALARSLTGRSRGLLGRELLAAVAERQQRSVYAVLGVEPAAAERQLREAQRALLSWHAAVGTDGSRSLLDGLESRRRLHNEGSSWAAVALTVHRRIDFELAAALVAEAEAWPGLRLRPTVERAATELGRELPSLAGLMGVATAYGVDDDDVELAARAASSVLRESDLRAALPEDAELSDAALARLEQRASEALRSNLVVGGRVGRSGVERAMDRTLSGRPGLRFVERNASAREQRLFHSLDVAPGADVALTIDARLQAVAESVVASHHHGLDSALVVLGAKSGDVLAMAGRPLEIEQDGELRPRMVPAPVTWRNAGYLGSLAKPFVLLEQLVAARGGAACQPLAEFGGCARRYRPIPGTRRWLQCDGVHGERGREPAFALAHSCNVFFFQAAEGLGLDGLRRAYARAGWVADGAAAGGRLRYQNRVPGVSHLASPRLDPAGQVLGYVGIGYGLKAPALLVARAYAALATGALPTVGVIRGVQRPPPAPLDGVTADDLRLVHEGLRRCVTEGTASDVPGLAELGVHGKTGTAEVNAADDNNAWFAGFVLAADGRPTLAFAAVSYSVRDHGKESARMVADFFAGLLQHAAGDELRRTYLDGMRTR